MMELKEKYVTLASLLFSFSLSGCAITVSELKSRHSSFDGSFMSKAKSSDTYRTIRHISVHSSAHAPADNPA
ncbi:hypothetical protein FML30_27415 [Klebsiella oxytoca]|nr:hypothetical protein [Klebsiella oxytoca]